MLKSIANRGGAWQNRKKECVPLPGDAKERTKPRGEAHAVDYKSRRWRRLRERVLRRDRYLCRESARYGRLVPADTVHHIWPAGLYPEYAWCAWNLVSLSAPAHNAMHRRGSEALTELGESWRRRTPPPSRPCGG